MCFSLDYAEHVFKKLRFHGLKKCSNNKKEIFIIYIKKAGNKAFFTRLLFVLVEGLQAKMWTPFAPFPPTGSRWVQFANQPRTGLLFHRLESHIIISLFTTSLLS